MKFNIATAPRKTTKQWKNITISWQDLVIKLITAVRTGETVAQYKEMSNDERDGCKDRGGFVGGYLLNGQRKRDTVKYRSLVTLDADNCTKADKFSKLAADELAGIKAVMYTTHSHTPEKPRWRIVIALKEKITPEQYEPVARKIADKIGIDFFDPTTYEASRLMYWPSACDDGEFLTEVSYGEPLDAAKILAEYEDWRDMSAWPVGKTETVAHAKTIQKLGDPREKNGIVGAFCRAYSIEEAIAEFLPEIYLPCDVPNRYTYAGGSTTAGVIIYDDGLHAFSHHATDPISGQDVNAFDLVRLNLYGALDEDVKKDTPVNKLPSYAAMTELASKQDKVKAQQSAALFGADADQLLESDENWKTQFLLDSKGKMLKRVENFLLILFNDPKLKNAFGLDDFSHRLMVKKDLPWRKEKISSVWLDSDDAQLRNYISKHYHGLASPNLLNDALEEVFNANRFHQVKDWLNSLEHDGKVRAERLLIDYLGAEDCEYTKVITVLFLKAAVARVYHPGTKFDQCLVLTGPQGIGKSTVLARLGGKWFNDSIVSLNGKDAMEQLQGSHIVELSEMQATNRAENDQIKSFISRQVDKFRAPYGRRTEEYPRQCVFAATTNENIFLKDRTGGRRFWIVPCHGCGNIEKLDGLNEKYMAQVWAEVRDMYMNNHSLMLPREIAEKAKELQKERTEGTELEGMIAEFSNILLPEKWEDMSIENRRAWLRNRGDAAEVAGTVLRDRICSMEIFCEMLGGSPERIQNARLREINTILANLPGWERPDNKLGALRCGKLYGTQRCFIRKKSTTDGHGPCTKYSDDDKQIEKSVNENDIL